MNECSPKRETGNEIEFLPFVQDTGKYLVWLPQIPSRAKRSDNRPNLLRGNANANYSLSVVRSNSHYAQPGFLVRLESLPERDNCSANNVRLESFDRWHGGVLFYPPLTGLTGRDWSVLLDQLVVMNVTGACRFRFPDRERAITVSILRVGMPSRFKC